MNKYLNIIIVGFFSFCLLTYDIGLSLVIPIIMIYALLNSKSLVILIPMSLISTYIYNIEYIYVIVVMYLILIIYLLFKNNNIYIDGIYITIISLICFLILYKWDINGQSNLNNSNNLIYISCYTLISTTIFIIIRYLLSENKGLFTYFEVFSILLSTIGASLVNIELFGYNYNIGFVLACFYAMYFSYNTSSYFSIIYSVCSFLYLYYVSSYNINGEFINNNIDLAIIIPFISVIYLINNIASSFITVVLSTIIGFVYREYIYICLMIDVIVIVFELLKKRVITQKVKRIDMLKDAYSVGTNELNKEIIGFCSFLDMCTNDNSLKEYQKRLKNGIEGLCNNYCEKCKQKNKCLYKYIDRDGKSIVKEEMEILIKNSKNVHYDLVKSEVFKYCPYSVEIRKSAMLINDNLNNIEKKAKSNEFVNIINTVTNLLRQFMIDNNIRKELDYEKIYKLRKSIEENGYKISYYNIKKPFEDDFVIEIGIRGYSYDDLKENIRNISERTLKEKVSVMYDYSEAKKEYIKIIPYNKCKIDYCVSNIASEKISGDNLLVSNKDGKTVAIICDGMGKGYKANIESKDIISKLDELLSTNISSYTIVQIVNTYSQIKDDINSFCTLDFLEIDKKTNSANFIKMSASPSYIIKKNKDIIKIENKRLPLGNEMEIIENKYNLDIGDLVVMSSDGIFENVKNEKDLLNYICSLVSNSVEKVVYNIIDYVRNNNKYVNDDMSIIVLRVLPE